MTRGSVLWRRWLNKPYYVFRPRQVARRLRRAVAGGRRNSCEINLPWGLPIRFRENHSSGAALARTGIYDLCVTETLYRLAEPGELAVDVGANIGYMTSVLATKVGPTGRVLSVEPNPEPMALLSSNVARWVSKDGSAAITVRESAMSDKSGVARLYAPDEHEWSSLLPPKDARPSDMLEVRADRLDELIDGPIGVLKIDAEGAELKVLRGAEKLLERRWIRDVIVEEHNRYPTEVTRFLEDRGFSVFRIDQAFLGVRISAPGKEPPLSWDPPSYLATLDPDRALTLLRKKGWAVFGFPA